MQVRELPDPQPTALVANLPYNVSVPVVLNFLEAFPTLERVLVMVQLEVAERLAAKPGSKAYGVPSVKAAWYAAVRLAGTVPRSVFWPVPNVESGLVLLERRAAPITTRQPTRHLHLHRRGVRAAAQDPARGPGGVGRVGAAGRGVPAGGRDRPPDAGRAARDRRVRRHRHRPRRPAPTT